jgi:hypothetical protein
MTHPVTPDPDDPRQPERNQLAHEPAPTDSAFHPTRYDVNLSLIRRRLADEQRTHKSKPWWKKL